MNRNEICSSRSLKLPFLRSACIVPLPNLLMPPPHLSCEWHVVITWHPSRRVGAFFLIEMNSFFLNQTWLNVHGLGWNAKERRQPLLSLSLERWVCGPSCCGQVVAKRVGGVCNTDCSLYFQLAKLSNWADNTAYYVKQAREVGIHGDASTSFLCFPACLFFLCFLSLFLACFFSVFLCSFSCLITQFFPPGFIVSTPFQPPPLSQRILLHSKPRLICIL